MFEVVDRYNEPPDSFSREFETLNEALTYMAGCKTDVENGEVSIAHVDIVLCVVLREETWRRK